MLSADLLITEAHSELRDAELRAEEQRSDDLYAAVLQEALSGLVKPAGEQKRLSPWLFYDDRGSQLFERITELPEYYLTRTERAIFAAHAMELPLLFPAAVTIAELGAGTASKTGVILREFAHAQGGVLYQPIDISPSALDEAAIAIRENIDDVRVEPQVANYITEPYSITRPDGQSVLALYIGSSIGNFAPSEARSILSTLRGNLVEGDALLLGTDLAPGKGKSVDTLIAAYDDAAGVTAAFNRNVLVRLNRELGANFDVDAFAHRARWNGRESRMEMHLESLSDQAVNVAGERVVFAKGETIHTENSYKFTDDALSKLLQSAGFERIRTFHDAGRCFAVTIAKAV